MALAAGGTADVVVLTNRTSQAVTASVKPSDSGPYRVALGSGDVLPLFSDSPLNVSYRTAAGQAGFQLSPNSAYYFGETPGGVALTKIGLVKEAAEPRRRLLPGGGATTPAGVINVAIYVDEDERSRRDQWEQRLRSRIAEASVVLLAHSGMTLRVTRVAQWESEDSTKQFSDSLAEFEREAPPPPGGLSIGFTSQYQVFRGRIHMGGTRGPLHTHILLREWSQHVSENERLELLVHELGHFLGAAHSPEVDSVMRPVLGDRQSRRAGFAVRFDPLNTLVMSLVGEEVRRRRIRRFDQLSPATRSRLNTIYRTLAQATPGDASNARFAARTKQQGPATQAEMVRTVLQSLVAAGRENADLPDHQRLTGDSLTEMLVRRAAAEALPYQIAGRRPLLYALAIALDDAGTLRSVPATGALVRQVDQPGEMAERNQLFREATLLGRRDLMKHFLVSAALVAAVGDAQALALGLAKEVLDSNRASGFSFRDLAADRAGVRMGQRLLSGKLTPVRLADSFTTEAFLPDVDDLPEGLSAGEFNTRFGSVSDQRFGELAAEIDERIARLQGYR